MKNSFTHPKADLTLIKKGKIILLRISMLLHKLCFIALSKENSRNSFFETWNLSDLRTFTLSRRRPLSYRNQSIDWTGFYMITASVMKGLKISLYTPSLFKRRMSNFKTCRRRCSIVKRVPRNFAKFTGKHLWQSLFLK